MGEAVTHDERIEAMAEAFRDFYDVRRDELLYDAARAAWAAADVEGMVREAMKLATSNHELAKHPSACGRAMSDDEIVARVLGK